MPTASRRVNLSLKNRIDAASEKISSIWPTAFTLQNVAYVKAVGQVELIFSLAASILFFNEKFTRREAVGIALISASVLSLVLFL